MTRRETFEDLERIWMKEVDIYSNIEDAVKMVVANKVDLVSADSKQQRAGEQKLQGASAAPACNDQKVQHDETPASRQ